MSLGVALRIGRVRYYGGKIKTAPSEIPINTVHSQIHHTQARQGGPNHLPSALGVKIARKRNAKGCTPSLTP